MLPARLPDRIRLLRWAFPLTIAVLVAVYQLGLARWVHDRYSEFFHFSVEILFYGTVGPMFVFWALSLIGKWLAEKEHAEEDARASERRLAAITAASADAILGLTAAGQIDSWNHGAELLFGYGPPDILGRPFTDLFAAGEPAQVEYAWLAETVRREGFVRGHETTVRDALGRDIAVELTATRVSGEDGLPPGMSVILRDITQRRLREQEIRRLNASLNEQIAERTRELGEKVEALARANADLHSLDRLRSEFVSLVSHQIRAPLTNMRGAAERMRADCAHANPTCARMLSVLDTQTSRLDRLVRNVLSAARLEAGELALHPEPVSLLPIARQVVEQARARAADRPFLLPDAPGLPLAYADRDHVAEVLTNLIDNADKYSPAGQAIVVEARATDADVTISVCDSGPGLPPKDLERVFDKFYRADGGDAQAVYGYGLGLYVCRQLVEAQGGRMWAENAADGGAVFSFSLPAAT